MNGPNIICRTYMGAMDLYHGVPDLKGAVVEDVIYTDVPNETDLVLRRTNGETFTIRIGRAE